MADLSRRVRLRFLDDEIIPAGDVIEEMLLGVTDRLLIRLEADELPKRAESIVVEATVKALRLRGYEGSKSESLSDGGSYSNTFIDDVLDAYDKEISALRTTVHSSGVKFL